MRSVAKIGKILGPIYENSFSFVLDILNENRDTANATVALTYRVVVPKM